MAQNRDQVRPKLHLVIDFKPTPTQHYCHYYPRHTHGPLKTRTHSRSKSGLLKTQKIAGLVPEPASEVAKAREGWTQRPPLQPLRTTWTTWHGTRRPWWASRTLPRWTFLVSWLHGGNYAEAFRGSWLATEPDPDADLNGDAPSDAS